VAVETILAGEFNFIHARSVTAEGSAHLDRKLA
jgi:hypothetical protein